MKNILLFFCLFALRATILAQPYYVRLEDASGINTDRYQDSLEMAAADLMNAFPTDAYRDSFRVYDFGFYQHQEAFKGGYPEAMQQKIQEIAANGMPYYLLFGKQTDKTGIYTKIWVEVKLPTTRKFSCLTNDQRKLLRINLHGITNSRLYQPDKSYLLYARSEIRAIDSLKSMVTKIVDCCYSADNSNCTQCLTPEGIQTYLLEQGFIAIPIKILGNATFRDSSNVSKRPSGRVTDCAQKSIEIDGVVIPDLGEVIDNIMSCYGDPNAKAVITDNSCNCTGEVMKSPLGDVILRIHVWQPSHFAQIPGLGDTMYVWIKNPDKLGKLPFKAHMPVSLSQSDIQDFGIDVNEINNSCISIFYKNQFEVSSFDNILPEKLEALDIINVLFRNENVTSGSVGRSGVEPTDLLSKVSTAQGYLNFNELDYPNYKGKRLNYIIGYTLAHELTHQIVQKSILYIDKSLYDHANRDGGHINGFCNLMLEGNAFNFPSAFDIVGLSDADKKILKQELIPGRWNSLVLITHLMPKENVNEFSKWELIAPTHKFIICSGMIIYECEKKFGRDSKELNFVKDIFGKKIKTGDPSKFNSY